MLEKKKKSAHHNFLESRVTSSNCLFFSPPTTVQTPEDIQHIHIFERMETECLAYLFDRDHQSIIKIVHFDLFSVHWLIVSAVVVCHRVSQRVFFTARNKFWWRKYSKYSFMYVFILYGLNIGTLSPKTTSTFCAFKLYVMLTAPQVNIFPQIKCHTWCPQW